MTTLNTSKAPLVLVGNQNGVTVIPQPSPLTRLNYFDGKFLRASDLSAEQRYLRRLVELSNQAGGAGVVHGYNLSLATGGDTLNLGSGLAIDPQGRVLLLPEGFSIGVQDLIDKSQQLKITPSAAPVSSANFVDCTIVAEAPADGVVQAGNLYLITIGFAEALCGTEDVFGKLCEEACTTSTDRPYLVEGVILRAIPLQLQTPLPTSATVALSQSHLRSRVASSYFEDERRKIASFISGDGLHSDVWCLGAEAASGLDVPIGVLARAGNTTLFVDAWIARRERIDTPSKRYWQWRMAMRPWDVYLAQILQFQCQLSGLFKQQPTDGGGGNDPCASARTLIREATDTVAKIANFYQAVTTRFTLQPLLASGNASEEKPPVFEGGLNALLDFQKRLQAVSTAVIPSDKFLIDGGIIELPSAGYLPVAPNSITSVNEQVRSLLGKGIDLRFCIVRPDFVAHALEEAQHMERISLLQGLDDPKNKPKVDILVPSGEIIEQKLLISGLGFEAQLDVNSGLFSSSSNAGTTVAVVNQNIRFQGAARAEKLPSGGGAIYLGAEFELRAGTVRTAGVVDNTTVAEADIPFKDAFTLGTSGRINLAAAQVGNPRAGAWISLTSEQNIFEMRRGDLSNFNARGIVGVITAQNSQVLLDIELNGALEITQEAIKNGGAQTLKGHIENAQFSFLSSPFGNPGSRKTILVDLEASVTLTGASAIDIVLTYQQNQFILSANWEKQPMEVKAAIRGLSNNADGKLQEITFAAAALKENADVLLASNANHQQALQALDVVAAGLHDVNFAAAKARLLFPPPPPPTDEIIVRATTDWVLFHRRRDKQCGTIVEAPPTKSPETYRIFDITAPNLDQARAIAAEINNELTNDLPAFARRINALADSAVDLVIKFAGDSSQPLFDFTEADVQWQRLGPGRLIANVFHGSRHDNNEVLQISRLRQFESAIGDNSQEDSSTVLHALVPFPKEALPPDADGVMLFVTVAEQMHVYVAFEEQFKRIISAANDPNANLSSILNTQDYIDLGLASYTVKAGGEVTVSDTAVINAFHARSGILPDPTALVVSRQGDPSTAYANRTTTATQIIQHLGGDAGVILQAITFAGSWPFADAPSVLVVQVHGT